MPSLSSILSLTTLLALATAQGVIISAQGTKGSPASLPLQVQLAKADANIINATEITQNVVNECGRTLLGGNIDIGENTETQLAAKTVTSVTKGGSVAVSVKAVDGNGKGPYTCDLDPTGNALATGQTKITVKETDAANGDASLTLTMGADLACAGASTGNVCTVRCVNPQGFGGCFAVQQTDVTPGANSANTITSAQTLEGINAQIAQNNKDLPAAFKAAAEAPLADFGVKAVDEILSIDSTALATAAVGALSTSSAAAAKATNAAGGKKGKGNGATAKGANGAAANGATAKGANGNAAANANGATAAKGTAAKGAAAAKSTVSANAANANAATGNAATANGNGATAKGANAGNSNGNGKNARAFSA